MGFDIRWAAGLFEGEGSIGVAKAQPRGVGRASDRPILQLGMVDLDAVETFADIMDLTVLGPYGPYASRPHAQPIYKVQAYGDKALSAMVRLRGYMHDRRASRIDELLEIFA